MNILNIICDIIAGLQISFAYGSHYAADMFCGISRMYVQLMYVRILHYYGTLTAQKGEYVINCAPVSYIHGFVFSIITMLYTF